MSGKHSFRPLPGLPGLGALRFSLFWGLVFGIAILAPDKARADEQGADLAFKYHCRTCHGDAGRSERQRYPVLAGQQALYLRARLEYFRDGVEVGNQMNGQAAPLSDEDIAALARYYSEQTL